MADSNKTLYFSCQSGISGDMTVAALLDLGLDRGEFEKQLASLGLDGYRIEISRRDCGGINACDFNVVPTRHEHVHRHLKDIESIILGSGLTAEVKDLAMRIFGRLAAAEAKVHGVSVEEVHFHEVGAVDSIVDIVSASICLIMIGAQRTVCSPVPTGSGYVQCAHGLIPVPAPATVELLKGAPVYQSDVEGELVTPTGAAIIQTVAGAYGPLPRMRLDAAGYGAGKKKFKRPNVLRVFLGTDVSSADAPQTEDLLVLETNIDDMNPEIYSYLMPELLEQGALDVHLTNVLMKKGRPGVLLSVLCRPETELKLEAMIFAETTTLGIRQRAVSRCYLERRPATVETRFGPVKIKEVFRDGKLVRRACEYEECRRIA
ncbi:MAG: nickel pincer cofactor biosynthesis protein LarC, partial [Spirochaetales bacterium]|nr:nickel pincer cofactor biosynthesis protein LarC [Spirochaetales bacterium]